MALPKMSGTVYNTIVPSTGKTVKFRPFIVREQKSLLIAQQSEDQTIMIDTLKSVIRDCCDDTINIDKLAIFDLEYLFLQIRAKSVGEIVELGFICDECETQTKLSFDLTKITVTSGDGHSNKIDLDGHVGITMKYPDTSLLKMMENFDENNVEMVFDIVVACIDTIFDADQVYHAKEQSKVELEEFINSLNAEQFAKIQKFFVTMPRLQQLVVYDCPKCKHHHNKMLEGINSFF